jgi:uncharacterized membrane protein
MNKTKGSLTITQTNVSVNKPISLIHIIIRKVHDKNFAILMNTGGAHQGISSMLNLVIGLLSGTRAVTSFCDLELM